jgi:transposase
MMGVKARVFQPMVNISLEELVPADHFYRHLERTLDLRFVRDLVRERYSAFGRPSIDPVVFFKLQLVMFFEGIRSERQLERVGSDRLSVRWYLGYDLNEALPDHSSLTRIRDRYGITIFRRFFEAIVERCQEDGLIWGKEVYADATLVEANADRDNMLPRFAVEAHLQQLFGAAYQLSTNGQQACCRVRHHQPRQLLLKPLVIQCFGLAQISHLNVKPNCWSTSRGGMTGMPTMVNPTAASSAVATSVPPTYGSA